MSRRARRYPALQVIALLMKFAAISVVFFYLLAMLLAMAATQNAPGLFATGLIAQLFGLGVAVIWALFLWALAESILVIIDIEANTRSSADTLRRMEPPSEQVDFVPEPASVDFNALQQLPDQDDDFESALQR